MRYRSDTFRRCAIADKAEESSRFPSLVIAANKGYNGKNHPEQTKERKKMP
jgi:hypothetical protein